MQLLEVSGAVRPIYGSLGVKRLTALERRLVVNHGKLPAVTRGLTNYNPASLSPAAPGWKHNVIFLFLIFC